VDGDLVLRGYALTGMQRDDLVKAIDRNAKKAGFLGYIDRAMLGKNIVAYGDNPKCLLDTGALLSTQNK
jgi:hypothetical protein